MTSVPALKVVPASEEDEEAPTKPTYEFDGDFQTKIAALLVRDPVFNQRVEGLVKPDYFEDAGEAKLVDLSGRYFAKFKRCPDPVVMKTLVKKAIDAKIIRGDLLPLVKEAMGRIYRADISDRDFVVEEVASFAQHQAMEQAIINSVELLQKRDFASIKSMIEGAVRVGANDDLAGMDFFADISDRTQERRDILAGTLKPDGISTGCEELDKELTHCGWGRKELSLMMGAAKAGKSMSLGEFGKNAALLGYKVLYATLEVSAKIIANRLDANISDIAVRQLGMRPNDVEEAIKKATPKSGKLFVHEFPTGTMKPSDLRRLINNYKARGIQFDLIVVDYADIMAPEVRMDSDISNFRSIYVDLRAIAQEENAAMLTATQTNREGAGKSVAKMTDVAEDFNKIRIADVVISINATDEEKSIGEARLFFAASRNQADGFTLRIKQDRERMKFLTKVLGRE